MGNKIEIKTIFENKYNFLKTNPLRDYKLECRHIQNIEVTLRDN